MSPKPLASDPLATLPRSLDFLRPEPGKAGQSEAEVFLARLEEQAALTRRHQLWDFIHLEEQPPPRELPATQALLADMRDLLQGRAGLFTTNAQQQSSRHRRDLSVRLLLRRLDQHATAALQAARDALRRLRDNNAVRYARSDVNECWSSTAEELTFDQLTHHHVASPAYLDWALQAGALPAESQVLLVSLLKEDAELHWHSNHSHLVVEGRYRPWVDGFCGPPTRELWQAIADDEAQVDEMHRWIADRENKLAHTLTRLKATYPDVVRVLNARPFGVNERPRVFIDSEAMPWTAYVPYRSDCKFDTQPWPFLRAQGCAVGPLPSTAALAREARVRRDLGKLIKLPENLRFAPGAGSGMNSGPSPAKTQARNDWIIVTDSGLVLRVVGDALQQLADLNGKQRRCTVCWRHLSHKQRLYCRVHQPSEGVRADFNRLAGWAERRNAQWTATLTSLWNQTHPCGPERLPSLSQSSSEAPLQTAVDKVTQAWLAFEPYRPAKSHPVTHALRLAQMHNLLDCLLPFTKGDVAIRLRAAWNKAAAVTKEDGFATAPHPVEFFRDYFSKPQPKYTESAMANTEHAILPNDLWHPLREQAQGDDKRSSQLQEDRDGYLARDLILDLLAQRVWSEVGGDAMDVEALRRRNEDQGDKASEGDQGGKASDKPRGYINSPGHRSSKINDEEAHAQKAKGWTHAEIARHFGVTPAAVSQFFSKAQAKARPEI